jgi:DNA processing protein
MNAPNDNCVSADAQEQLAALRLSLVDGLGPVRIRQLLGRFQTASAVFRASKQSLQRVDGVGATLAEAILDPETEKLAAVEQTRMRELGVKTVYFKEASYPQNLLEIHDAPLLLRLRGDLTPGDKAAVAIVGSRQCTSYGRKMAQRLSRDLAARGVTIISGLARGIDGVAHQAALEAGGRTIAVLASGVANIYPPEHAGLAEEISKQGAVLSEAALDGVPRGELFPRRNRIISGLSLGVVVVEAGLRSGTLSTARHALEQNREVFAVPGRVGDKTSEGTNSLLKQGACLVRNADDVLEQLGPIEISTPAVFTTGDSAGDVDSRSRPMPPGLDDTQTAIYRTLEEGELELEELLARTRLRASEASSALFMLEMKKLVRRKPGNRFERM